MGTVHGVRAHGHEKPFHCEFCGHSFVRQQLLDRHLRIHTGEKPFRCEHCGEGFGQAEHLKTHMLRHKINDGTLTEEEKQKLEEEKRRRQLRQQQKTLAGIKDFICVTCGKAYGSKRAMEAHYNIVHLGEKNFPCQECGKLFGRKTTLQVHMLSHTGELPFQCEYCNAGFKEKRNMQNHVVKVHQNLYLDKDEDSSSQEGENSRTSESETSSQKSSQNSEDPHRSSQEMHTRVEEVWVGGSHTSPQFPTAGTFESMGCVMSPEYSESHPQPGGSATGMSYSSRGSVEPNTSSEDSNTSPQEIQQQTTSPESREYPAMHSSTPLLLGLDKTYHHNFQM